MQTEPVSKPSVGQVQVVAPGIACILAPNPSPMTYWGTNTYLLGQKTIAVIDPGPDDPAHLAAVVAAIDSRPVSHILLTHSHIDHSAMTKPLAALTGAPVYAFGNSLAGRSDAMRQLAQTGYLAGGEGVDQDFEPDICITDGTQLTGEDWDLTAVHTPGHFGNHLCFAGAGFVLTGDLVMGWASSLVSPPDGDLTQFLQSCHRLRRTDATVFYPGHGAPVSQPLRRLDWLIAHRENRTKQIIAALHDGVTDIKQLTKKIYHDIDDQLQTAAQRNVFAHLIALHQENVVFAIPQLNFGAQFSLVSAIGT